MIKRIYILLLSILFFATAKAQLPRVQTLGNDSTLVYGRSVMGGYRGLAIIVAYADTTEANTGPLDGIPGSIIRTVANVIWFRNEAATAWVEVGAGGGGGGTPGLPANSVQYNDGGVFTGSANLTYDASLLTALSAGLGTTQVDTKGIALINTTAAAAGAQQISPALRWSGQGWKTDATAESQEIEFRAYVLPEQYSSIVLGKWQLETSLDGTTPYRVFSVSANASIEMGSGSSVSTDATWGIAIGDNSVTTNNYGISIAGSKSRALGAMVLSTNAIDSSANTFMGGGQNTVIRQGANGSVSLATDGEIFQGAAYALIINDANDTRGESSLTGGFGGLNAVQNGFAFGNTVHLGTLTGTLPTANAYDDSWAIGSNIKTTGDRNGTLGYRIQNTGQEAFIIGMGRSGDLLYNSVRRRFGIGMNSDSLTFIIEEGTGVTGNFGTTRIRGLLRLESVANDNTEDRLVTVNATTGDIEYRTVASLPGGGGTIGGSIADDQVAVGSAANTIEGTSALTFTSGALRVNSQIGINTAPIDADVSLHVSGTGHIASTLQFQQIIQNTDAYSTTPSSGILFQNKYNAAGDQTWMGAVTVHKLNATDGDYDGRMIFWTRKTGEGVLSPGFEISSNQEILVGNAVGADAGDYRVQILTENTTEVGLLIKTIASATSDALQIQNSGGTTISSIDENGYGAFQRVGLGTFSPSYSLDIQDANTGVTSLQISDPGGGQYRLKIREYGTYFEGYSSVMQMYNSYSAGRLNLGGYNVGDQLALFGTYITVKNRFNEAQGADVASAAGAIALGTGGNTFEITGTSVITLISSDLWQNGSVVTLAFTSTATLTDGTANSGTDIGMELAGNTNFVASAGATVTLRLIEIGGTQRWREIARSVN
jgi:hypothetical protein